MAKEHFNHLLSTDVNVNHKAWPWIPGNASWIEPTAHTLVALKKVPSRHRTHEFSTRISEGESMLLCRRGRDGGWNCGNPSVYKIDLPSYPETTALAMLGLQGRNEQGLAQTAQRFREQTLLSEARVIHLMSSAAQSSCGQQETPRIPLSR